MFISRLHDVYFMNKCTKKSETEYHYNLRLFGTLFDEVFINHDGFGA